MGWARRAWLAVALLAFAAGGTMAAEPKRVLLLHSFGPDFRAEEIFAEYLRTDLAERSPYPLDRYEVSLEIARFADSERDEAFAGYLRGLFAAHRPDLIVTMVSPAARFIQRHRRDLFPSTPVIFAALDSRAIKDATLTANDTMVTLSTDLPTIFGNIFRTLPNTTTLAIVIGNTPIEKFWANEYVHALQAFEGRVKPVFMNDLTLGEIQKRLAALPPASAIFFGDLIIDAEGVPYNQEEVLARLHAVANAPIFGQYDYQLGAGIVGGPLLAIRTLSRKTAEVAARVLDGTSPGDIKTPPQKFGEPEFDWRELRRWGVAEANLPPHSTIRFREPTLWDRNGWYILAAAGLCGFQGILIVGLLLNRLRLRRAHDRLRTSEEGMSLAALAAKLRFWVWDIPSDEVRASDSDWSSGNWHSAHPVHFDDFIDVVHPDDRALLRQAVRGAFQGDGQYETEYRVILPDSTVRWIASRGRVEFDQNSKPRQLRAISIDITERRHAEDEARELNGRLITAHEDERARLAHALHDDVTQRLALLAIDAGHKEKGLGDPIAGQAMRSIRHDLVQLSEDVHALSYALHPAILEDLGLIEALKAECARFGAIEGIPTSFEATDDGDEPPTRAVSLCLYRVAQEALRNVARHSNASSVELELRVAGIGLELAVQDNGVGFDPTAKQARPSLGLAGMRQRLFLVDGELVIDSAPGGGTRIVARAPMKHGSAP